MAVVANKRSTMTLYFEPNMVNSHRVRIALAEKSVSVDLVPILNAQQNEELIAVNPYGILPTLVDRDLVLYEPNIITEYLDERFPHPPLMPVYPVARAKCRTMLQRMEQDWLPLVDKLRANDDSADLNAAKTELIASLLEIAPVFAEMPYFLNEEFSLVDCCLAPILWRLTQLGMEIPASAKPLKNYMERVFARPSFRISLAEIEMNIKKEQIL